jgi:hypothetical protein
MAIYLDGLERSGNVYLSHAVSLITGIEVISSRRHTIEVLKNYDKEFPFIVPVRDAIDSISSAKIYRDHYSLEYSEMLANLKHVDLKKIHEMTLELKHIKMTSELKNIIERYKEYIQYLVDNPKFFIAPFYEFTEDVNKVIKKLSKQYPDIKIYKNVTFEEVKDYVSRNKNVYHPEYGNLPRETPKQSEIQELLKSEFLEEIQSIQANIEKLYKRYHELS